MPDYKILTKTEYKNGIIKYFRLTRYGSEQLPFISRSRKQNKRLIHSTLWNCQKEIVQFLTIKPSPQFRVSSYSAQNKMVIQLMKAVSMPKYAFVNELNDKNPDSVVYGTYHTHALVSEYRSKGTWETAFGKGFVSVDEVNNAGRQINYVLKYLLKSKLPKGARVICKGFDKVKRSRVDKITEPIVAVEIENHKQVIITNKGDAPY